MGLRHGAGLCLFLAFLGSLAAQDRSNWIFNTFNGRFQCNGQSMDFQLTFHAASSGLLGMDDDGAVTAVLRLNYHTSLTSVDQAVYKLAGPYDRKTGHFRLEPKEWSGRHPDSFQMVGIDGTFDFATQDFTAKPLSTNCAGVQIAGAGKALPEVAVTPAAARGIDMSKAERKPGPTNVTQWLDPASDKTSFEYWIASWSEPEGIVHQGQPIDESVAQMKKDLFMCGDSTPVRWDPAGSKGTATDRVTITERFVIECVGNCKGVFYRPYTQANIIHLGLTTPLPTMQIKSVWLGGTNVLWHFSRADNSQPPPEIYIHHWVPLAGFGPFDPDPKEIARRQAAAPPCRAPKTM